MSTHNVVKGSFFEQREKRIADIISTVKAGVYMTDNHGTISFANKAFAEIFKYSHEDEIVGLNIKEDLYESKSDRGAFLQMLQEKGLVADYSIRMVRKDGSKVVISARSNLIKDEKGNVVGVAGVVREIPEPSESRGVVIEEIGQMATLDQEVCNELEFLMRDPMTGSYNYQYFMKALDLEIKRANRFFRQLSLMMLEIDNFSESSANLESATMEQSIRGLNELLKKELRDTDILSRQTGSQFIMILPETDRAEALQLAKKIKDAIEKFYEAEKKTCSIGMSRFINGMTMQEFILKVNLGLYMAKEQGGNEACFYG